MNDLSQLKPLAQLNGWRDPTHEFEYLYVIRQASKELCEKVLTDAKTQLHPLLRQVDLEKLGQRSEFTLAFKNALEKELARKIVLWLPSVKVVYNLMLSAEVTLTTGTIQSIFCYWFPGYYLR